jgi:hypothetical protein
MSAIGRENSASTAASEQHIKRQRKNAHIKRQRKHAQPLQISPHYSAPRRLNVDPAVGKDVRPASPEKGQLVVVC